jgi:hypothetical protein
MEFYPGFEQTPKRKYEKRKTVSGMTILEKQDLVRSVVEKFYYQNGLDCGSSMTQSELNHILDIGTSILCTKWKVGFEGGGFVQAFVNNDLMNAIGRADSTTIKGFKFFGMLVYNVAKPYELIEQTA